MICGRSNKNRNPIKQKIYQNVTAGSTVKKVAERCKDKMIKKDFAVLTIVPNELFTIQDKQIIEEGRQMPWIYGTQRRQIKLIA